MTHLELRLLGPLEVRQNGQIITGFESNKVRAMLAMLAAEAPRPQARESLAELLWPGWPQQSAMSNLRYALADLRKVIGDREAKPPFLIISREMIQLNLESDVWVDAFTLNQALARAGQGETEDLRAVVELYRGPFLEGFGLAEAPEFSEWLLSKRAYYQQQALKTLSRLADQCSRDGDYEQGLKFARRALEIEPWLEEGHQQVMRLLELSGQRSAALMQYEECTRLLKKELGVGPSGETRLLYERIANGSLDTKETVSPPPVSTPASSEPPPPNHNLPPQLTRFFGREKEIAHICQMLSIRQSRLVTLTGAGGVGKTRLSLQVAERALETFPDGVWFVELAPLSDPHLVTTEVAYCLGVHELHGRPIQDSLVSYLHNKRLLLVLDNCEHLLAECARLVDVLLKNCPKIQILATSREILSLAGETSFRVPSLPTPDPGRLEGIDQTAAYETMRLFTDRARQVSADFDLDETNARDVATICQRLDGIPLAIELAAARVRMMTPALIAARLDNVFRLLTGGSCNVLPRQQTLKATIDWSYALLSEQEQWMLQRLSVFSGGWTLEAAEAVCTGEGIADFEVLDLLGGLVDKSLVLPVQTSSGDQRFRMLETVRQYAREKLALKREKLAFDRLLEAGGVAAVRDRHLSYYLQMGRQMDQEITGSRQLQWLNRLEDELENLRLALDWSLTSRIVEGLRLAADLSFFWQHHNRCAEGAQWVEKLLAAEAKERGNQPLAAGVQNTAHLLAWVRAISTYTYITIFTKTFFTDEQVTEMLDEAIRLCRDIGEPASWELAWALFQKGGLHELEESLAISQGNHYRYIEANILTIGLIFYTDSESEKIRYREAALAICESLGDMDLTADCRAFLGLTLGINGDLIRARKLFQDAQAYKRKGGNRFGWAGVTSFMYYVYPEPGYAAQVEEALAYYRDHDPDYSSDYVLRIGAAEWRLGNYQRAESLLQWGLESAQKVKFTDNVIFAYDWLIKCATSQGDLTRAGEYLNAIGTVWANENDIRNWVRPNVVSAFALFLYEKGRMVAAARLFGALKDWLKQGNPAYKQRDKHIAALERLRATLGEEAFEKAWQAGQSMTPWQAFEYGKSQAEIASQNR